MATYLGMCMARLGDECLQEATHEEWLPLQSSLTRQQQEALDLRLSAAGLPAMKPVTGIWQMVCRSHCDPKAKHKS
jgi:hypothetical protein